MIVSKVCARDSGSSLPPTLTADVPNPILPGLRPYTSARKSTRRSARRPAHFANGACGRTLKSESQDTRGVNGYTFRTKFAESCAQMCARTPRHGLARGGLGRACTVPLGDTGGVCHESHATSMEVTA